MSNSGRPRLPTKVLEARGSWRASLREGEFSPPVASPEKPESLTRDASKIWDVIVPQLVRSGIIARIDGPKLERYCETLALWRSEKDRIAQLGTVYMVERRGVDAEGKPFVQKFVRKFPGVSIMSELATQLDRIEREFGMSPAARSRIIAPALGAEYSSSGEASSDQPDKRRFLKLA